MEPDHTREDPLLALYITLMYFLSLVIKVFRETLYLDSSIGGSCCSIVTFPILTGAKNMIIYTSGVHVLRYVGVVSRFNYVYKYIQTSVKLYILIVLLISFSKLQFCWREWDSLHGVPSSWAFFFFAPICWIINKRLPIGTHWCKT